MAAAGVGIGLIRGHEETLPAGKFSLVLFRDSQMQVFRYRDGEIEPLEFAD